MVETLKINFVGDGEGRSNPAKFFLALFLVDELKKIVFNKRVGQ